MQAQGKYELVYIVSPDSSEEQVAAVHAEVEALVSRMEGRIENTENWGRRRLAYEIGGYHEGTYVLELVEGSGALLRELDRRLRVLDQVIRHLVIRVDRELSVLERSRTRRKRRVVRRRVARGLPAEPVPVESPTTTAAAPSAPGAVEVSSGAESSVPAGGTTSNESEPQAGEEG